MKAVLFCRVSSREQESGYSLDAQRKLLTAYAEKKEYQISKVFSLSESASGKEQRKIFNEMLAFIKAKDIKIIICEKVDRLTRNKKSAVDIDEWITADAERQAHFVKENFILTRESRSHDKFLWSIKVSVAQFYTDNLSEEVRKGQEEKLKQGWYPGQAKLGYKTIEKEGHRVPVPDKPQSEYLKKALELFATGNYSVKKLTDTMYEEGLRSKQGKKVVTSRIYDALIEPFYYGYFYWNGQLYKGNHEPLIKKEIFDKNQSLLKRKNAPKYTQHKHLFKGLTHCSECGGAITWERQKERLYGYCNHFKPCSQTASIKEDKIESQLIDCLDKLRVINTRLRSWIRKVVKEGHRDEVEYHQLILEDLNQKLEKAQKRLDKLLDMKVDEEIDEATYKKKFKEYSDEKDSILDSIEKHSKMQVKSVQYSVSFYELSQRAKEIYLRKKDVEDKRGLMRLMFASLDIEANTGTLTATYTKPFKILSELIEWTNENSSKVELEEVKTDEIFEPVERLDDAVQMEQYWYAHPEMRRGRDSNSRRNCFLECLVNTCTRPLCDLSKFMRTNKTISCPQLQFMHRMLYPSGKLFFFIHLYMCKLPTLCLNKLLL